MKLIYKNYIAEEENGRFNLYKDVTMVATKDSKNHKKGDEYVGTVTIGYGYTFERLLRRMAEDIVGEKDISTLNGYIEEFRCVIDELENVLA